MKFKNKNILGFTLVELLVVISIIGILTMIGMVSYSGVQKKARDTQRKSDLDSLSKALIMYYNDHGSFPLSTDFFSSALLTGGSENKKDIVYISQLPIDPKNVEPYKYVYKVSSDNKSFNLFANLENKQDSQCIGGYVVSGVGYTFCYGISSPNSVVKNWTN